eukprot:TRINITY_DN23625_c0_g1_i1.p1 TRINITY_DN23625_c0_g1~~TRINITY_DN23625_c0_g1_i1.p1  ORF type:complete len:210 (+),score=33.24 TRINITY_DN23625_c0_g1_i1:28-630(+)
MVAPEEAAVAEIEAIEAVRLSAPSADTPALAPAAEETGVAQAYAQAIREQYAEGCSVYVGNLELPGAEEIWPEQIADHFNQAGEVKRVTIKVDRTTGDRLGFGYVDFQDETSAEVALGLDGSELMGRTLKVDKKRKIEKGKGMDGMMNGKGWGWGKGPCMKGDGGKGKGWWGGCGPWGPWGGCGPGGKGCWGKGGKWGPY